ncbi:MAG: PKD domain-containing protein [Thermoplasmata archaeon]
MEDSQRFVGRTLICGLVAFTLATMVMSPIIMNSRAAIPVPHNSYGHAFDKQGVTFSSGELITAWIDGVSYGWNVTFDDMFDPDPTNRTGKYDVDTYGNQVTIPSDPDTPWIKEGGDHGIDDIMYVWGDMTDLGTAPGYLPSAIFEQNATWRTFVSEYMNLTIAPVQPPALPKINNITTEPPDWGNQYLYVYGPPRTAMNGFYLEKNDGQIHGGTRIDLFGETSQAGYLYVDLGSTDYLNVTGDELKLVWDNPGGMGAPFAGREVVVDRIEFNASWNGTHYGEPDNTIMPDAIAPYIGYEIHRHPLPGSDTNDCAYDFVMGVETGRAMKLPPVADAGVHKVVFMWEMVTFDGSGSYDPDGFIVDYFWDFDDGSTASWTVVNHTYLEAGEYYVTLTVTDDDNLTDKDTIIVIVLDPRPDPPNLLRTTLSGANLEDVIIEWQLSSDDSSGFNDVINYAVYWSGTYDHDGAGYQFLTELPPGTNSLILAGWGDGDWSNYFFYVQANDTDGYVSWNGQVGKFVRFLEAGRRIASVPLIQDDEALETVLQSLSGSYNHVRYYKSSDQSDHWKSYWTFKYHRDLYYINHGMGFWIKMTKDDHLVVAGLVPGATETDLGHQWNFVGYPCFTPMQVQEALAGVDYKTVDGYDDTPPFHLAHMGDTDMMVAGEGYWVWVDLPQTWMVYN